MPLFFRCRFALIAVMALPLTGCLFRTHKIEQPIDVVQLQTASQQQLIDFINSQAAAIQSMQATVDIDTTVGGVKKGKVTDYEEIRGYVLARKPAMLRMIGLLPIVRNKAFDMVSDGQAFKLWIPPKNRFVIGRNDVVIPNPTQAFENVRPQHIYDALLLRQIDPQTEIAVMENDTKVVNEAKNRQVTRGDYIIDVVRKTDGGWLLSRKIIFNRADLLPSRQLLYDDQGNVITNARYGKYKDDKGMKFPWQIEIARPRDEYDITLNIVKLDLNQPLQDDKFILDQPVGAEVIDLDKPKSNTAGGNGGR